MIQSSPRPHDILHVDIAAVRFEDDAPLALSCLQAVPFAVVRRAANKGSRIPIGIRGSKRHERFAAWISDAGIQQIIPPESLRCIAGSRDLPALAGLAELQNRWSGLQLAWGPAGSVGFELATHQPVAYAASDLDILLRAQYPLSIVQARALHAAMQGLACAVDAQIETPQGAFSLAEYLAQPAHLLLRTFDGPQLVSDPWSASWSAREPVSL